VEPRLELASRPSDSFASVELRAVSAALLALTDSVELRAFTDSVELRAFTESVEAREDAGAVSVELRAALVAATVLTASTASAASGIVFPCSRSSSARTAA
jgi:hypothetical protein